MKYNKWTDEQIEFVLKLREEGLTYNAIARRLEQAYSVKKTGGNIRIKMRAVEEKKNKEEKEMKIPENYEPATKKQCRFYAQLTLDKNSSRKELNRTTELLYGNSLKGRLSKSFLQKAIADLVAKAEIEEKSVIKTKGRETRLTSRWSEDEQLILLHYMYKGEVEKLMKKDIVNELASKKFDNRSVRSIEQQWAKLKRGGQTSKYVAFKRQKLKDILIKKPAIKAIKPKVEKLPEKIENFVEKHGNPTTRHLSNDEKKMLGEVKEVLESLPERKHERSRKAWKSDEEFELLCNFYELSIDEARNRFGRSYGSLALRLEMIVDSEEPEHIAMLKKAAKVISKRKKEEAKNANMSRWKRRRIARKAKKAAKLEKKLNKLRGV
jgi:hypothetical protein